MKRLLLLYRLKFIAITNDVIILYEKQYFRYRCSTIA